MADLTEILQATQQTMNDEIRRIRAATKHTTNKGTGAEQLLARFLRDQLPASLGVVSGEVLDSQGHRSKQLDVIIYNALKSPMLFQSPGDGVALVPAEGVVAVIEVKMHLKADDLASVLANCRSVKQMERSAYIPAASEYAFHVYERTWRAAPIIYSLFAFESDNMYAGPLNDLQADLPLHERIDSVGYLDRGVNLNVGLQIDLDADSIGTRVSPTAFTNSGLQDAENSNALLLWFLTMSSFLLQADCPPINLLAYAADELSVSGPVPGTGLNERFLAQTDELMTQLTGLSAEIHRKLRTDRTALTQEELTQILETGFTVQADGAGRIPTLRERGLR